VYAEIVHAKNDSDGWRDGGENVIHCQYEKRSAQGGTLRNSVGLRVDRAEIDADSDSIRSVFKEAV